jgi:hypothetical protein
MLTFSGNFFGNLRGYFYATFNYVSSPTDAFGNVMNSVSWIGLLSRFYEFQHGWGATIEPLEQYSSYLFLPGLLYLALVLIVVSRKGTSVTIKLLLTLSLISLIVPASGGYLLGWITIFLLYISSDFAKKDIESLSRKYLILIASIVFIVATPGFVFYGSLVGFSRHIPLAPLLFLCLPALIIMELSRKIRFTKMVNETSLRIRKHK